MERKSLSHQPPRQGERSTMNLHLIPLEVIWPGALLDVFSPTVAYWRITLV